jgi:multicomponent Na+:H+ antiporter subunit E
VSAAFIVNLVIAIMWLLLSSQRSLADFVIGLVIGFAMLAGFQVLVGSRDYTRRTLALLGFALAFAKQFVLANLSIAGVVLFRSRDSLSPNFITYDVAELHRGEILLLAYCITLTPGTTSVNLSEDFKTLIIHAMDADQPDRIRREIDVGLRQPLLRFTR